MRAVLRPLLAATLLCLVSYIIFRYSTRWDFRYALPSLLIMIGLSDLLGTLVRIRK